jgi:hypothetical protein
MCGLVKYLHEEDNVQIRKCTKAYYQILHLTLVVNIIQLCDLNNTKTIT